jgi:hypothetical protein
VIKLILTCSACSAASTCTCIGSTTAGITHIVPYNNGETVYKTSEDGEQNFR